MVETPVDEVQIAINSKFVDETRYSMFFDFGKSRMRGRAACGVY